MKRRGFIASILAFFGIESHTTCPSPAYLQPVELKKLYRLRLWKLGSLEHRIYPTEKAVARLAELLKGWDGKSDLDIIWGPDIECEEHLISGDEITGIASHPDIKIIRPNSEGTLKVKGE